MWYEKINVMSDSLEYWVSRSESKPIVQNNRYLIPIEVKMYQMMGETNVVPKLRTWTRGDADRSASNNEKRIEEFVKVPIMGTSNMGSLTAHRTDHYVNKISP